MTHSGPLPMRNACTHVILLSLEMSALKLLSHWLLFLSTKKQKLASSVTIQISNSSNHMAHSARPPRRIVCFQIQRHFAFLPMEMRASKSNEMCSPTHPIRILKKNHMPDIYFICHILHIAYLQHNLHILYIYHLARIPQTLHIPNIPHVPHIPHTTCTTFTSYCT